ncbi:hypothetical protein RGQ29_031928 [Quercus rubra]|nr:hypothetical protein RGQ29_031928 [Quercus rubra]
MGLLEILLSKQPVQNNQVLLKIIEICRLYELDSVSSNIMKVSIMMNSASKEKTQADIRSQLVVESIDFPQKLFYCFWWELVNLRYTYIGYFSFMLN